MNNEEAAIDLDLSITGLQVIRPRRPLHA